ncbi:hypothetical protein CUMW_248980 [Citrus unshiu]|nr:hypothetical protein CUMW_248980 [Citrus unshiu]
MELDIPGFPLIGFVLKSSEYANCSGFSKLGYWCWKIPIFSSGSQLWKFFYKAKGTLLAQGIAKDGLYKLLAFYLLTLCRLEWLTGLFLNQNMLFGHILQCLGSLTSLRTLFLSSNTLTSSIPSSLWSLEYILYANLSTNSLSGPLSSDIQNLKVLIELIYQEINYQLIYHIGGLKDLATLSLARNQFYGLIPESFGSLIRLESLDLPSNNLSREIPKSMEALSYLKQRNVSHNKL